MTVPAGRLSPRAVRSMLAPWRFVVLFGLVGLFADMVYEDAVPDEVVRVLLDD